MVAPAATKSEPGLEVIEAGLPASESAEIEGELLTERDLAETAADFMEVSLPDGVDQGWLLKGLWEDLRRGEHAEAVLAEAEMRRVIDLNQRLETRTVDGMGQLVARIPLSVYLHWTARYGEDFWRQKDSIDFILKRAGGGQGNPGFKVESTMKPQVMVDGFRTPLPSADGPGFVRSSRPLPRGETAAKDSPREEGPGGDMVKPPAAGVAAGVPAFAPDGASARQARRGPVGKRGRWAS